MRTDAKNCFYPVIVENEKVIDFGEVETDDYHPTEVLIMVENKLAGTGHA